jgi:hypothetical protein
MARNAVPNLQGAASHLDFDECFAFCSLGAKQTEDVSSFLPPKHSHFMTPTLGSSINASEAQRKQPAYSLRVGQMDGSGTDPGELYTHRYPARDPATSMLWHGDWDDRQVCTCRLLGDDGRTPDIPKPSLDPKAVKLREFLTFCQDYSSRSMITLVKWYKQEFWAQITAKFLEVFVIFFFEYPNIWIPTH